MSSKSAFFSFIVFLSVSIASAQIGYASEEEGVAFDGYDLITYHQKSPKKGDPKFALDYQNMHLLFTSAENKRKFLKTPDKYLPAYGGWCATAMVYGRNVRPDFTKYKIQNDKLLFFEVKAFFNGQTQWEKDPDYNETLADSEFRRLHGGQKTETSQ